MTLDEAKRISDLLSVRESLLSRLREIERCSVICAEICSKSGGRPTRWDSESDVEVQYLINGYKADIAKIDARIAHLASPNFPTKE